MAKDEKDGIDRRGALECIIWAGTGVMAAGVPRSSLLGISEANAQAASGFTFLQISDSHIGFKQKLIKDVVDGVSNVAQVATAVSLGSQSSANLEPSRPCMRLSTGQFPATIHRGWDSHRCTLIDFVLREDMLHRILPVITTACRGQEFSLGLGERPAPADTEKSTSTVFFHGINPTHV
jgi:hypothetical protein